MRRGPDGGALVGRPLPRARALFGFFPRMATSRRVQISETLRQRVLNALHFQRLAVGSRLPSARTLASELDADARVILAAYRALEREGVVERRPPSRAFFVAGTSDAGTLAPTTEWLVDVLVGSLARGVHVPDFPEHARRSLETLRLRAACIECNTDQLVWLSRELEEDFGIAAARVEPGELRESDHRLPPEVRSADLLLTTPAHEEEVRPLAERLGRPCFVVTWRADLMAEVTRLLALGPVYFVGVDPRFADKLGRLFATVQGGDNVRPVILGRDEVASIPPGSPAWVMRTARERLGEVPAHVRALSTLRAFAPETQRAILRFVVQANLAALASRRVPAG